MATIALILVALFFHGSDGKEIVCDNGTLNIELDLKDIVCEDSNQETVILKYFRPSGHTVCEEVTEDNMGRPVCMNEPISYTNIPTSGDYRPLAPQYGEYDYLPPQRWLHAMKYGAVVFLYNPCAALPEQILELKHLARSCLWKHVITPSLDLSDDKPFALVTWGCLYLMSWVDSESVVQWIHQHSLQTQESVYVQDGQYKYGLIQPSSIVSTQNDSVLCPSYVAVTTPDHNNNTSASVTGYQNTTDTNRTTTTSINISAAINSENHSIDQNLLNEHESYGNCSTDGLSGCPGRNSLLNHYPVLYGLIVVMAMVMVAMMLFVVCVCCNRYPSLCIFCGASKKHRLGRYKPCKQYEHGGGSGLMVGIAIPELGFPKTLPVSEREKLLIDSDEDNL